MKDKINIIQGDITKQDVAAIVNAANNSLLGGGGVDGAIHKAAGPDLLAECRKLNGCETGQAKITGAYLLPAKWVIHTVGPIWLGGHKNEEGLLVSCYRSCFYYVKKNAIKTIAFPSISTGAYGYPISLASKIALEETKRFLLTGSENSELSQVLFVCFSQQDMNSYRQSFAEIFSE